MSNNTVINEKKKALLAYKEKILEEIKYYEKSIDDFRANHKKNNSFYDDHVDSSDSEDDIPSANDTGPSIPQLKMQEVMMKTCLQATQELTSLMVLQSEVNILVEEPKLEGERPVAEAGTWREVMAECRIDLVPFTITFFMHTPNRKFAPTSYRGLRVVPVKCSHELELAKSVLHSLKLPSDAVEVLRSYAVGYRSRRTTLARLANKYGNALFMEPHAEGGFVLKCADLLEVSWRLENKWSPVAPFHHRMKFDVEYMDETYIKIITQAHKQLLDPAIQTDERTLLLAKIITTCLEVRGPIDPESDLESKTTERDNDIDKRDSETEKRDSEVMAPPKSLPKKVKQRNNLTNTAQKRSLDDDNHDLGAKKLKNYVPNDAPKRSVGETSSNARKSKINGVVTEGGKKRKINEVNDKVASVKNVKESDNTEDGGTKPNNDKEGDEDDITAHNKPKNMKVVENTNAKTKNKVKSTGDTATGDINDKPKNIKDSENTVIKTTNSKTKNKVVKAAGDTANNDMNNKPKNMKDAENGEAKTTNTKTKHKVVKAAGDTANNDINDKPKNMKDAENIEDKTTKTKNKIVNEATKNINPKSKNKIVKDSVNSENTKKTKIVKDIGVTENKDSNANTNGSNDNLVKNSDKIKNKIVKETNVEVKNNNKPKNMISKESGNHEGINQNENNAKAKSTEKNKPKTVANIKSKENIDVNKVSKNKIVEKNTNVANIKNLETNKPKTTVKNVASTKNDNQAKTAEKNTKNIEVVNKGSEKTVKNKQANTNLKNDVQTVKKVTEKHATNIKNKDKLSQITNKVSEKIVKDKQAPINKDIPPEICLNSNIVNKKVTETNIIANKKKEPIKTIKNITHKISSHRNTLKVQNPLKSLKTGNTKIFSTSNTEKENGGKGSKIPQKKLSTISEGSSKKNLLRISPRKIPSKFKTLSQESFKQKMVKITNIPRLLKKPAPKTA